jgi:hypothetical protein
VVTLAIGAGIPVRFKGARKVVEVSVAGSEMPKRDGDVLGLTDFKEWALGPLVECERFFEASLPVQNIRSNRIQPGQSEAVALLGKSCGWFLRHGSLRRSV